MVLPHHMNLIPPPHGTYPHHIHHHPHHHHHHHPHIPPPPPLHHAGSMGGLGGALGGSIVGGGGGGGVGPPSHAPHVVAPMQCHPMTSTGCYDDVFLRPGPVALPPWDDFSKMDSSGGSSAEVFGDYSACVNPSAMAGPTGANANSLSSMLEEVVPQQAQTQQQHFTPPYMVSASAGVMADTHSAAVQAQQQPPAHGHQYRYSNLKMSYNNSPSSRPSFTVPSPSSSSSSETGWPFLLTFLSFKFHFTSIISH